MSPLVLNGRGEPAWRKTDKGVLFAVVYAAKGMPGLYNRSVAEIPYFGDACLRVKRSREVVRQKTGVMGTCF